MQDSKHILTLIDSSEHEIENNMCMDNFACHQFLLVDKPGYAISQECIETPFSAQDVIYAAAGRRFGIRCDGKMNVRHIAFTGENIRPLLHYCRFGEFRVTLPPSGKCHIRGMFDEIFNLKDSCSDDKDTYISTSLYSLLACLGAINIENDNYVWDKKSLILRPVISFMQQNYRKPDISYKEPALGVTLKDLDDLFMDVFSMSAHDYYKRLRMENAKHLLFFYNSGGADYVAVNMGYSDTSEFTSDFYEQFKITPDDFIHLYWNE